MFIPHTAPKPSLTRMMLWVLVALLPAVFTQMYFWGNVVWLQLALGTLTALVTEIICLKLSKKPVFFHLKDGTAVLTAWLLALSIPPFAPWFVIVVGTSLALILAKHVYGGMGQNIFNPAMVGFAIVIVAFPSQMGLYSLPFMDGGVDIILGLKNLPDAMASATPLDALKNNYRQGHDWFKALNDASVLELLNAKLALSLAYFIGGAILIWRRIITWWVPFLYIAAFALWAAVFSAFSSNFAIPLWVALSQGAIFMAAFFIITDPVTAPASVKGKMIFVCLCASLTFIIRMWGNFPDGVAFAVLLGNICVPLIDRLTIQNPFGGSKKQEAK